MKKSTLYIFVLLIVACTNDDFYEERKIETIAEVPLEGLRIKQVEGDNITQYFYHKNGFIDSISVIGKYIIGEKFVYDEANQIIKKRYYSKIASEVNFSIFNTTYFTYNSKRQITYLKTYNKDNVLQLQQALSYNNDGSLYNPTQIVKEGNLVQQNASQTTTKFTFDTNPNPFYKIYPNAYCVAFYINKNNVKSQKITTPVYNNYFEYQLRYNTENYIIEKVNYNNPNISNYSRYYYY